MNCFAAKTTNHCLTYTQRRFDVVTLFMFHVAQTKMAASSLLLNKKKKSKVSVLVSLRTNQGVFQLEQSSMPCFLPAFFVAFYISPLEACAPPFVLASVVCSCAKHVFLSNCRTAVHCHSCPYSRIEDSSTAHVNQLTAPIALVICA